jgi:hypothetical protein
MQNQKTITIAAILGAAVLIAGIFAAATTPLTAYADKDNKKDKGEVKLSQNKSLNKRMMVVVIQTTVTVDKPQLVA